MLFYFVKIFFFADCMNSQSVLANRAEAFNLLLGLNQKASKTKNEPGPLPEVSPISGVVLPFGSTSRSVRGPGFFTEASEQMSWHRFQSSYHPVLAPICDIRPNEQVVGVQGRLQDRPQLQSIK
jgi:hypothetical protein